MAVVTIRGGSVQLPAVKGTARWVGGAPSAWCLECGSAYLVISTATGRGDYWVGTIRDGAKLVGYRLTKFDPETGAELDVHDIDTSFGPGVENAECDCKDFLARSHRRAEPGCRHTRSIFAALRRANLL